MFRLAIGLLAGLGLSAPALANVHDLSDAGFVIRQVADVKAGPDEAWSTLVTPSKWWSKDQSYSRDAANFSLDERAGGCLCEVLPNPASPRAGSIGSVEHMRVAYIERPRALRMTGALGPLSADAVNGTLTILIKPLPQGGSRIMWEYVVGGYMRRPVADLAKATDIMMAEQVAGLAARLGRAPAAPASAPTIAPQPVVQPRPAAAQPAPVAQPAQAVPREEPDVDFFREMEAGLAESPEEKLPEPPVEELPAVDRSAPQDNVFIGR